MNNRNRKMRFIVVIVIAFCLNVFGISVFAVDATTCPACGAPSPEFQKITSFVKEMTMAIKTV